MDADGIIDFRQLWTTTGVVLGFAVTALTWRIGREVKIADRGATTWLPPADWLNLGAMLVAVIGVFVLPILDAYGLEPASFSLGLALVLFVGHAFALIGHYELFTPGGRTLVQRVNEDGKTVRDFAYRTVQELIAIVVTVVVAAIYAVLAVARGALEAAA